jgi:hypothetical protein
MTAAVAHPAPHVEDLPSHFTEDHGGLAASIAHELGVKIDWP